jgi:Rrf2 family protein
MLCLTRQVEYALIALEHLAQSDRQPASARSISNAHGLPLALMMKILKRLHGARWLSSVRGWSGGYGIRIDLREVSIRDLIEALGLSVEPDVSPIGRRHRGVQALQYRLIRFLTDVRVWDLIAPGRRIDIPAELLLEHAARRRRTSDQPNHVPVAMVAR